VEQVGAEEELCCIELVNNNRCKFIIFHWEQGVLTLRLYIIYFDFIYYVLLNEILTALNNKQMVGVIFCDLHKAFDY